MITTSEPAQHDARRTIGWHATATDPDELYYWDGEAWTQHLVRERSTWVTRRITPVTTAATPVARGAAAPEPGPVVLSLAAVACSILIIVGSLGTWVSVSGVAVSGTARSLGYVSLIAGVVILVATLGVLISRGVVGSALIPFVTGAAGIAVAIPAWLLYEAIRHAVVGSVGWGLYVVLLAGFGAFVAGAVASARTR